MQLSKSGIINGITLNQSNVLNGTAFANPVIIVNISKKWLGTTLQVAKTYNELRIGEPERIDSQFSFLSIVLLSLTD